MGIKLLDNTKEAGDLRDALKFFDLSLEKKHKTIFDFKELNPQICVSVGYVLGNCSPDTAPLVHGAFKAAAEEAGQRLSEDFISAARAKIVSELESLEGCAQSRKTTEGKDG